MTATTQLPDCNPKEGVLRNISDDTVDADDVVCKRRKLELEPPGGMYVHNMKKTNNSINVEVWCYKAF